MRDMKKLVVYPRRELVVFPAMEGHQYGEGKYLVVVKCRAGFPSTTMVDAKSPIEAFRKFQPKFIMNISKMGDGFNSTVYARVGKKVWIAEEMLREMKVGDINQDLYNTALYNQYQYKMVNSTTWDSMAYVMN